MNVYGGQKAEISRYFRIYYNFYFIVNNEKPSDIARKRKKKKEKNKKKRVKIPNNTFVGRPTKLKNGMFSQLSFTDKEYKDFLDL